MLKKTAEEFYETMAETYREETGFDPAAASDIGIRMKALAQVLASLTGEIEAAWHNAFPQTAGGEALNRHAGAASLLRKPALPAGGTLRFYRATPATADLLIPAGTLCAAEGDLRFETTAAGKLEAGNTFCDLPAVAQTAGEAGNVPPGAIKTVLSGVAGIAGVTNPIAFTGGSSAEPDDSLRARLMAAIADPPAAANPAFYREAALAFPGVRSAKVLPGRRGAGSLDVVIAALPGQDAASCAGALKEALEQLRAAGVDLMVAAAQETSCELAALVVLASGFDTGTVLAGCKAALSSHMAGLAVGEHVRLAALTACLMGVEGVENLRLVQPAADVLVPADRLAVASVVEVEGVGSL